MAELDDALRDKRRGPLSRLTLFASGADTKVLAHVPADESTYLVLGTFVLLATCLAGASAFVSTGFWVFGEPRIAAVCVAAGLLAALFIFVFDRALVRAPLNPYQFPPEVLEALWNPSADSKWFAVLNDSLTRPSVMGRIRQFGGVLVAGGLRVAVSICVSFLVAEVVLFLIFQDEVTDRVKYIRQETIGSAVAVENASHAAREKSLNAELAGLTAAGDAQVVALQNRMNSVSRSLERARDDVEKLEALKVKEVYGGRSCSTLSDGLEVCSSGRAGAGPANAEFAKTLAGRRETVIKQGDELSDLKVRRDDLLGIARSRETGNAPRIDQINSALEDETNRHALRLSDLNSSAGNEDGLLIRHEALARLTHDRVPETVVADPVGDCEGIWVVRAACSIWRVVWPSTPAGAYVVAFRLVFLIIDLMPIFLKIQISLRRRRPYDALRAALEERYSAEAVNHVDSKLVVIGEQLEHRASMRKAGRSGTGAEYLLRARGWLPRVGVRNPLKGRRTALSNLAQTVQRGYQDDDGEMDPRVRPPAKTVDLRDASLVERADPPGQGG